MRRIHAIFSTCSILALAGCATQPEIAAGPAPLPPPEVMAAPAPAPTVVEPVRYSAKTFFDTTSFNMAAATGLAFSADGESLLIGNDQSGVFNAYLLPIAGGAPAALTSSTDNATFP